MTSLAEAHTDDYFDQDPESEEQKDLFNGDLSNVAKILDATCARPSSLQFSLDLTVKAKGGAPNKIPLSWGTTRAEFIEEVLQLAIESDYFLERLRAVVGEPSGQIKQALKDQADG